MFSRSRVVFVTKKVLLFFANMGKKIVEIFSALLLTIKKLLSKVYYKVSNFFVFVVKKAYLLTTKQFLSNKIGKKIGDEGAVEDLAEEELGGDKITDKIFINWDIGGGETKVAFHLTEEIIDTDRGLFLRPLRPTSESELQKLGPKGSQIVRDILGFRGIEAVSIKPYQVLVCVGAAFDLMERKTRVLKYLKNLFLDPNKVVVEDKAIYCR